MSLYLGLFHIRNPQNIEDAWFPNLSRETFA
ncbi:hypothetical protein BALAC2494_02065 [Bifidobacterium animalis subsp. lactis CNCM I-2494]|uniref:Uncharacterized protein n=2 Tax=Bifidobacterium animalis subsp. lactis TaxID=302911 RepID=B8DWR3_BIFA0|nr:hypothetical protein BLA_0621 [Bifidobacterium animalis subsp. lactis AD011]AEK30888.1 hypothetical protein BALAC2494_02065 [Bifidobacterium animalis subsp. lactis CNCM I-2494]